MVLEVKVKGQLVMASSWQSPDMAKDITCQETGFM
jgi:hypothetical protein